MNRVPMLQTVNSRSGLNRFSAAVMRFTNQSPGWILNDPDRDRTME
jgi:hypothetical protein